MASGRAERLISSTRIYYWTRGGHMDRERYTSAAGRANGLDGKQISGDNPSNYRRRVLETKAFVKKNEFFRWQNNSATTYTVPLTRARSVGRRYRETFINRRRMSKRRGRKKRRNRMRRRKGKITFSRAIEKYIFSRRPWQLHLWEWPRNTISVVELLLRFLPIHSNGQTALLG